MYGQTGWEANCCWGFLKVRFGWGRVCRVWMLERFGLFGGGGRAGNGARGRRRNVCMRAWGPESGLNWMGMIARVGLFLDAMRWN